MDGLGDSLLHGASEQDDDPGGGLRRASSRTLFPRRGDPDYDEALFNLVEGLTGTGAMYCVSAPEDGDFIVSVVAWYDDENDTTHAGVVCWPCLN